MGKAGACAVCGSVTYPHSPHSDTTWARMEDAQVSNNLSRQYGRQVEDFVIAKVTGRVGVDVRKPRWLPAFVWRWMWRHVVLLEERPNFTLEWPSPEPSPEKKSGADR